MVPVTRIRILTENLAGGGGEEGNKVPWPKPYLIETEKYVQKKKKVPMLWATVSMFHATLTLQKLPISLLL